MTREKNICFLAGNRVVVKGSSYLYNLAGTVLYSMRDYAWVEFDRQLPEICRNNWFPEGCPQERWAKVHKSMLRHLTTEKGTKPMGTPGPMGPQGSGPRHKQTPEELAELRKFIPTRCLPIRVERAELWDDDDGDPVLFFCSDTPVRQSDLDEAVRTGISDDDKQRWIHDTERHRENRCKKTVPDKH